MTAPGNPFDGIEGMTVDEQVEVICKVNGHFNVLVALENEFFDQGAEMFETRKASAGAWFLAIARDLARVIKRNKQ